MKKIVFILGFCLYTLIVFGQAQSADGSHFLVDFSGFTPPEQAIIKNFEGMPAEPFLANDIEGNEHFLGNYKGKKVILWFWNENETLSTGHLRALNATAKHNPELQIISFGRGTKAELTAFVKNNEINFPIIPNADMFGQMAYAADLGYPRYFFIDEYGIIKHVVPASAFSEGVNPYNAISDILSKI